MYKTLRDKKINQIMYISLGGAVVAIILFIIIFNIFSNKKSSEDMKLQIGQSNNTEEIEVEEANSPVGNTVEEQKNNVITDDEQSVQIEDTDNTQVVGELSENLDNIREEEESMDVSNNTSEIASMNNETSDENDEEIRKDPTFTMPVDGEIVKHYGKDKLIYSDTLKEWTTHLGIDIKADKTSVVKSAADGTVKSIKNDPRYGLTVVVEHENGFSSVYANLLTAEFVVVGETVKGGQTLGTVGNSATFEILDEAHLHFEILKDGGSVDPEMYIK